MIPDNVTLIVKAPNQQIEDQNIECQTSWTVKQLKGYLSEVYPNKPKTDEQKIIYAGKLLDDSSILKDVLRTYESQIAHTMHLVCTPKRRIMPESPNQQKTEPTTTSSDGLRHRNVTNAEATQTVINTTRPETRQNDQNHTVEMQNYLSSIVNNYGRVPQYPANYNFNEAIPASIGDPAAMANQMAMMQQAYFQYMQQYANMLQATRNAPTPVQQEVPPQAEVPAPPAEDDEAQPPRDWLDHLYTMSRLAILFSLVYLYASPARFLLVVLLAAAGYLHQIGFFRELNVNQVNVAAPNQQQNEANGPNENQPHANQPQVNEPQVNQPQVNELPQNRTVPTPSQTNSTQEPNNDTQQSLLAVTWMIFTSFFASLLPEAD